MPGRTPTVDTLMWRSCCERCVVLEPIRNEPRFQAVLAILRERGDEVLYELDG